MNYDEYQTAHQTIEVVMKIDNDMEYRVLDEFFEKMWFKIGMEVLP